MSRMITLDAPAKLNLFLDVVGRRDNGYHDIVTIFHAIDLCDRLEVSLTTDLNLMGPERFDCRIRLECDDPAVPAGDENLIHRAIRLLVKSHWMERNRNLNFTVHLTKRIPMGAGLAGGSTDAAAALLAVNHLLDLNLSLETLMNLAAPLGADIPFCLAGGTAIGRGIGDQLDFIPDLPRLEFLLAVPPSRIDTAWAYQNLKLRSLTHHPDPQPLIDAWTREDWPGLGNGLFNVFEDVVEPRYPEVSGLRQLLTAQGCINARMSGSGSAVFGFSPRRCPLDFLLKTVEGQGITVLTAASAGRNFS